MLLIVLSSVAAYIKALCSEPKASAVSSLLAHLPLLRPGNAEAKAEYLAILPKVLAHSIENSCHIEESRQLLSYSLIHPAITPDERAQFTAWLSHLEEQYQNSQQRSHSYDDHALPYAYTDKARVSNGWQAQPHSQRDSGIALNGADTVFSNHGGVAGQGRPITAASTMANANMNGGLVGNDHIPLHATASGPPAFNTTASQGQSYVTLVLNIFPNVFLLMKSRAVMMSMLRYDMYCNTAISVWCV